MMDKQEAISKGWDHAGSRVFLKILGSLETERAS
jgi:hypothetical protein